MGTIGEDDAEEARDDVPLAESRDLCLDVMPGKAETLDEIDQPRRQAGPHGMNERLLEDDDHCDHGEAEQRVDHHPADLQSSDHAVEADHDAVSGSRAISEF